MGNAPETSLEEFTLYFFRLSSSSFSTPSFHLFTFHTVFLSFHFPSTITLPPFFLSFQILPSLCLPLHTPPVLSFEYLYDQIRTPSSLQCCIDAAGRPQSSYIAAEHPRSSYDPLVDRRPHTLHQALHVASWLHTYRGVTSCG
ncbi:unnamed protein product [Periconia digitata]|uniref:Uncharacterized protein n=1 Tax=Periconia digitata TaxID=1303443 RepID=A0A9W4XIA2_9PLEO|nr:unnamed protein product [Periconia digitata]